MFEPTEIRPPMSTRSAPRLCSTCAGVSVRRRRGSPASSSENRRDLGGVGERDERRQQVAAAERIDDRLRHVGGHDLVEPRPALVEVQGAKLGDLVHHRLAVAVDDLLKLGIDGIGSATRGDPVQELRIGGEVGAGLPRRGRRGRQSRGERPRDRSGWYRRRRGHGRGIGLAPTCGGGHEQSNESGAESRHRHDDLRRNAPPSATIPALLTYTRPTSGLITRIRTRRRSRPRTSCRASSSTSSRRPCA